MKYLKLVLLASVFLLQACGAGKEAPSILDEISGVWKAQDEDTIVTIHTADNRTSFYIDEKAIPVTVGAIDQENKTVNFNVKLPNGNPEIWTLQQVWDQSGKSFHLRATLGSVQADLSFVRKVSVDDLNRLAALSNPRNGNATAVATAVSPSDTPASPEAAEVAAAEASPPSVSAPASASFAPSFDCEKASNGAERLICSDQSLAEADVQLAQTYKNALACVSDKALLKREQSTWMSRTRNACSDSECMLQEYEMRNGELQDFCSTP